MAEPGEQAAAHPAPLHQLPQHLDHHHLEQAVDHHRAAAALLERFFEQQFKDGIAAIQIGQRQADEVGQRRTDRVEPAALEMKVGAGHVGAVPGIGMEAVRHRARIQQQAGNIDLHRLPAMADLQRTAPHQMQLAGLALSFETVDATQRAGMEHRGGDREAFEQDGETIGHDGTPDQAEEGRYVRSYRIQDLPARRLKPEQGLILRVGGSRRIPLPRQEQRNGG
ncbi:hypothetical protein D3C73_970960 [compost metagenome]